MPARLIIPARSAWRLARLFVHLMAGLLIVRFNVPHMSMAELGQFKQRWGVKMLRILGVRLKLDHGELPARAILVCNHISWVDIAVIHAAAPAHFVCKEEVLEWPCVGWFVAATKTIFISRRSRTGAARTAKALAERLNENERVAFFPEGTTTNGLTLLPFNAALFEAATPANACVVPMALRYLDTQGRTSTAPAYDGDVTFMQCLKAVLAEPYIVAELKMLSALPPGLHRRDYAEQARRQIAHAIGL